MTIAWKSVVTPWKTVFIREMAPRKQDKLNKSVAAEHQSPIYLKNVSNFKTSLRRRDSQRFLKRERVTYHCSIWYLFIFTLFYVVLLLFIRSLIHFPDYSPFNDSGQSSLVLPVSQILEVLSARILQTVQNSFLRGLLIVTIQNHV